eukprot:TRINITY_DN62792_c0_g1_i1.p1 TRINITY_DN62792_c0_g1~~TRINITY_DN62792_c0_g1_i1.p1  ORF type:complete len:206 (-),score=7.14 TRINITY_DN62792_c0_g1_i1:122-739(-)
MAPHNYFQMGLVSSWYIVYGYRKKEPWDEGDIVLHSTVSFTAAETVINESLTQVYASEMLRTPGITMTQRAEALDASTFGIDAHRHIEGNLLETDSNRITHSGRDLSGEKGVSASKVSTVVSLAESLRNLASLSVNGMRDAIRSVAKRRADDTTARKVLRILCMVFLAICLFFCCFCCILGVTLANRPRRVPEENIEDHYYYDGY